MSSGLVQGLQRATETRQWASATGVSLGRSKERNLATRGWPFGVQPEGERGVGGQNLERTRPVEQWLRLENLGVCARFGALVNCV